MEIDELEGVESAEIFEYTWSEYQRKRDACCPIHMKRADSNLTLCGVRTGERAATYWRFQWADDLTAITCKRCRAYLKAKAAAQ